MKTSTLTRPAQPNASRLAVVTKGRSKASTGEVYHPVRRWFLWNLPVLYPADQRDKEVLALWRKLRKAKPCWYRPVNDLLTPEFGELLAQLAEASRALARSLHLEGYTVLPPLFHRALSERLVDRFLAKHGIHRDELELRTVPGGAALEPQAVEAKQALLERVDGLSHSQLDQWDRLLPELEALLTLSCHPWEHLNGIIFSVANPQRRPRGRDQINRLLDLYFVAAAVTWGPELEELLLEGFGAPDLEAARTMAAVLAVLQREAAFVDLLHGILEDPKRVFRHASYTTPRLHNTLATLLEGLREQLRLRRVDSEHRDMAAVIQQVFGNRELSTFPSYNDQSSSLMARKGLLELAHVDALTVLYSFHKHFDKKVLQVFFQDFQLEAEFVTDARRKEFFGVLDEYFRYTEALTALEQLMLSTSTSPLTPVLTMLEQPFLEGRVKESLKKYIATANKQALEVCEQGLHTLGTLQALLKGYLADADEARPRFYRDGARLRRRFPRIFSGMKSASRLLDDATRVMGQLLPSG